jgi:hypothetical protein
VSETTEIEEKKTKPWQWPGEWFRDEKFWRDVGSRTVSGLIVLFFGYWAALLLGFIKSPDNFRNAFQVTAVVMNSIWVIAWSTKVPVSRLRSKLQKRFPRPARKVGPVIAYVIAFFVQASILFTFFVIGLFMLRLVFTAAAALLGIEAKF